MKRELLDLTTNYRCRECDEGFPTEQKYKEHLTTTLHLINTVSDEENEFVITLPSKVQAGSWEAVESFSRSLKELRAKYPDKRFTILPWETNAFQDGVHALASILVVAQPVYPQQQPKVKGT